MQREELLKSKEYWMVQIQNQLFQLMKSYMAQKELNRTQLAAELNVTKGYVTQIMNGDFDHKISKLIELALACNAVPLVYFVDARKFINDDAVSKKYQLLPAVDKGITFKTNISEPKTAGSSFIKFQPVDKFSFDKSLYVGQ